MTNKIIVFFNISNITLVLLTNLYLVKSNEESDIKTFLNNNTRSFVKSSNNFESKKNEVEIQQLSQANNTKYLNENVSQENNLFNDSFALNEAKKLSALSVLKNDSTANNSYNETDYYKEEGRGKKDEDKFDKLLNKLDKGRVMKFDGSIMVPALMSVLLKVAMAIPVILAISTVIGTISLIGSKVSLLISAILGVRTLIQYYNSLNPPVQDPPPITQSDMVDIQSMIAKQNQMSQVGITASLPPMMPPTGIPAMKVMPASITEISSTTTSPPQTSTHVDLLHTSEATDAPNTGPDDMEYTYNHLYYGPPSGAGHFPEIPVDYHNTYDVKETLYYPDNYFAHNPAALDTYNLIHQNQLALDHLYPHPGPYLYGHGLKRLDKNYDKNKFVNKLKVLKRFSDKDVIKKVADVLKNNGMISKVKIVKTVKN